jgi:hypothetical protein
MKVQERLKLTGKGSLALALLVSLSPVTTRAAQIVVNNARYGGGPIQTADSGTEAS